MTILVAGELRLCANTGPAMRLLTTITEPFTTHPNFVTWRFRQ